ncbi:uncharacterized protein LOC124921868 isoform X2 [Impatiens glandulifera]|uniref:uncharacterized protein LOC124921868 isoform X2 n=1 Tax=Impatiens glandulifera TaxID=253017 RepID=UPI001FB082EC|nr:uncharacterized protein LOC124921868 isoform X2 [Impatiens glandulifera]
MSFRQSAVRFLREVRIPGRAMKAFSWRSLSSPPMHVGEREVLCQCSYGGRSWGKHHRELLPWIYLSAHAAVFLGLNASPAFAEDVSVELSPENDVNGLRRIEDGSVISNEHTSKWRVFTDTGRDLFLQGKLDKAEKLFLSALEEAKMGFGEGDPHVASACNNLAELYRLKKSFEKAEPLYMDAIKILENSFGPEDVRVAVAYHNLGQFYLVRRKLEEAHQCYEVFYLQGKEKDAEALIQESIVILEEAGQGESISCMRRLRFLAQMYAKSGRLAEAENIQRKILHLMELSKGWNSLDTVTAAESLALTIQSIGKLLEARELLDRCLEARKTLLPEEHVQIAGNMLHISRVQMLQSSLLRKTNISEALAELDKAKGYLCNSIRIAKLILYKSKKEGGGQQSYGLSRRGATKDVHVALVILLQAYNALAQLEIEKQELLQIEGGDKPSSIPEAESALRQCISSFKEFVTMEVSPEVKLEYVSCMKRLLALIDDYGTARHSQEKTQLQDEIRRVERDNSMDQKRKP